MLFVVMAGKISRFWVCFAQSSGKAVKPGRSHKIHGLGGKLGLAEWPEFSDEPPYGRLLQRLEVATPRHFLWQPRLRGSDLNFSKMSRGI